MTTRNQPATPLPWYEKHANIRAGDDFVASFFLTGDAMYAAHACNAYPRLVEALQQAVLQIDYMQRKFTATGTGNAVIAESESLLRELGELN